MQEVAKICYFMRDYEQAYRYYKKFSEIRAALKLDMYQAENGKIAMVMRKLGKSLEAEQFFEQYRDYAINDQSIYKDLNLAMLSAFNGDQQKAIEHIRKFSEEDNYHYWILLFLEMDPLMDEIKTLPEFKEIMRIIENKFWHRHEQMKALLEEQNLL